MMRSYIINLDRAPERMERMSALLNSLSVDFVRCPAVDGQSFTREKMDMYRSRRMQGKPLTIGEIACSESHLLAYKQLLETGDEYAVIMEDDLHFSKDAGQFLKSADWIPHGAEIIKLETVYEPTVITTHSIKLKNDRQLVQLLYKHWGSGAYVISRAAAQKMLRDYIPGSTPIDDYLFDPSVTTYTLWQIQPAIAVQDIILTKSTEKDRHFLSSDIEKERQRNAEPKLRRIGLIALLNREIARFTRKTARRIRYFWGISVTRKLERKRIEFAE